MNLACRLQKRVLPQEWTTMPYSHASKDLHIILNRCLTDKTFCERLLHTPGAVVDTYILTDAERTALISHRAASLVDLVTYLKNAQLLVDIAGEGRA